MTVAKGKEGHMDRKLTDITVTKGKEDRWIDD
jgi:hypothetical protein